ncbi:tetratricopeptide repeat protein [Hymenobacter arizonensis]|uniref:Tetratricopeptide repeat-containing protein n=1 Tax=Hymenobacter arizonensis TaxID=1227077 RepID=A0A1I6BMV5_HYMAR|nr:tetratricopeptide repeat protein [Hymenobacter arizonensis]SFQ82260.1 Tetratricopeptide repeat-containing protein [Hymenobacter arizonensis]
MKRLLWSAGLLLLCGSCSPAEEFDRGVAAYEQGRYQEANRVFSACLKQHERVSEALFYKGRSLYELNERDSLPAAVTAYRALLVQETGHDTALVYRALEHLGHAYYRLERYPKAFDSFYLTALGKPNTKAINFNLGVCLLALDRPGEASQYLLRECQRGEASAPALAALAEAYLRSQRPDSARFYLQQTLRQYPAYAPAVALQQELDSLTKNR